MQWQEIISGVRGCWEGHSIVPKPFWECWENRLAASLSTGMTAPLFMINSRNPKDPTAVNSGLSGNGGTFEARRDLHVGNKSYSWNPTLSSTHIIISSSDHFAPSLQPPHKFPHVLPHRTQQGRKPLWKLWKCIHKAFPSPLGHLPHATLGFQPRALV